MLLYKTPYTLTQLQKLKLMTFTFKQTNLTKLKFIKSVKAIRNVSLTLFTIFASLNFSFGQQLTIAQTIDYLNKTTGPSRNGETNFTLESNGILKYLGLYSFHFQDIEFYQSAISSSVRIVCNGGKNTAPAFRPTCITYLKGGGINLTDKSTSFIDIDIENPYTGTKIFNALSYLFALLKDDKNYRRDVDDPFAPSNYNSNATSISGNSNQTEVTLTKNGGVFEIVISIKGIKKKFILDSGASDVSISQNTEQELIQEGVLKKENYIESALYRVADGSIIKCRRFILPELRVGEFTVKNIQVAVGINNTPLLLGKSFLDKFSKWSINNLTNKLILEK